MAYITCVGDYNTGHDDCPAVRLATGSSKFSINGKKVGRIGDKYESHSCSSHPKHEGAISSGSDCFFVDGLAVGRVGDSVSCGGTVAEGQSKFDIGEAMTDAEIEAFKYELYCNELRVKATPTEVDETILALPKICQNMADNVIQDPANKQGWGYLPGMFKKWLTGPAYDSAIKENRIDELGAPEPFYIDLDWFLKFDIAKEKYNTLLYGDSFGYYPALFFRESDRKSLKKLLRRDFSTQWNSKKDFEFDYSKSEWYELKNNYFTYIPIFQSDTFDYLDILGEVNGLMAAMASCTIRTLAKGSVSFNGDVVNIKIDDVYVFVRDSINFAETTGFFGSIKDWVWSWDKDSLEFKKIPVSGVFLTNSDFNSFRKRYNVGMDYLVLSNVKRTGYSTSFSSPYED